MLVLFVIYLIRTLGKSDSICPIRGAIIVNIQAIRETDSAYRGTTPTTCVYSRLIRRNHVNHATNLDGCCFSGNQVQPNFPYTSSIYKKNLQFMHIWPLLIVDFDANYM